MFGADDTLAPARQNGPMRLSDITPADFPAVIALWEEAGLTRVAAAVRGTGVGRTLMRAAEGWLVERGAVKVQLMVRHTNTAVTGFYDRLGYADADVRVLAKRLG